MAFNIAQCYRQSQRPEQAIFYYKLFLSDWSRKNPNKQSPFRKEVEGHIHQLTQEIKAKKEQARLKQQRLEAAKKLKRASDEANALLSLEKERRRKAIWAYSSLGLALACAGTAAALYGIGFDAGNAANEEYLSSKSQQEMDGHYADVEKAKDMLVAGHVLAGVSAAALAFSIYNFATRPPLKTDTHSSGQGRTWAAGGLAGGWGVTVAWSY